MDHLHALSLACDALARSSLVVVLVHLMLHRDVCTAPHYIQLLYLRYFHLVVLHRLLVDVFLRIKSCRNMLIVRQLRLNQVHLWSKLSCLLFHA